MITEVEQKINEINDYFNLNFDINIENLINDEYNVQEINLLWYFICLYRTLHFANKDLDVTQDIIDGMNANKGAIKEKKDTTKK